MERFSILQVVAPAEFGGLEQVVRLLSTGLSGRGHEVRIAAVYDGRTRVHPFANDLESTGIRVDLVSTSARRYDSEVRAIRAICASFGPDIVHTHGSRPDVVAGLAARKLGLPRVTTVHGFIGGDLKNRLYEYLQVRMIRRFDRVAAVSRPLYDRLADRGVSRDRLLLIRNAWSADAALLQRAEARRALGLAANGTTIGWVGRLSREKGPDVLIRALPYLEDSEAAVSVIGDGPDAMALKELTSELGVRDRVRFHGTVADAAQMYRAFDCFVLSSRTEGTPIVLFEAMAAGVPIVATRVGGVADVVSDSEGRLVPPEHPAELAAAIRDALGRPDDSAGRARRARQRLEQQFAPDAWLEAYEGAYAQAVRPSVEGVR